MRKMAGCSSPLLLLLLLLGATSWASGALARTSWKKIKSLEAPAHRPLPQRLLSFVPRPLVSRPKKKRRRKKNIKIYIYALSPWRPVIRVFPLELLSLSLFVFSPLHQLPEGCSSGFLLGNEERRRAASVWVPDALVAGHLFWP